MMARANFLPLESKAKSAPHQGNHFMRVIALGRLVYGLILVAAGLTLFHFLGHNLSDELLRAIKALHLDSHFYFVHWLLETVSTVSPALLILLTVVDFFYAALAFIEAAGLVCGKRWAYWLVIIDTASFIPIETYQLCEQFGWINLILLLYYFVTTIYLLLELKRTKRSSAPDRMKKPSK
jgi:uncharacterized membrane protein (DUF2068 family)